MRKNEWSYERQEKVNAGFELTLHVALFFLVAELAVYLCNYISALFIGP